VLALVWFTPSLYSSTSAQSVHSSSSSASGGLSLLVSLWSPPSPSRLAPGRTSTGSNGRVPSATAVSPASQIVVVVLVFLPLFLELREGRRVVGRISCVADDHDDDEARKPEARRNMTHIAMRLAEKCQSCSDAPIESKVKTTNQSRKWTSEHNTLSKNHR
jgi:hypothetical protein